MKMNIHTTTSSAGYTADIAPHDNHNYYRIVTGTNDVVVQTQSNRRSGKFRSMLQEYAASIYAQSIKKVSRTCAFNSNLTILNWESNTVISFGIAHSPCQASYGTMFAGFLNSEWRTAA